MLEVLRKMVLRVQAFSKKPLGLGLKQFGKDLLGAVKEDIIEGLTQVK